MASLCPNQSRYPNWPGQRRIDVLELLKIVEGLKGDPKRVFKEILTRLAK